MVYLTKIDAARNMARFYSLDLQPTLFDEWALVRQWGRIGQAGQLRSTLYKKRDDAAAALERELRRRKRRGYVSKPSRFTTGSQGELPEQFGVRSSAHEEDSCA